MLRQLLESRPQRTRTRSAAILSLVVHATIVGSAVAGTATMVQPSPDATIIEDIIFVPPRPEPAKPSAPRRPTPPVAPDAPQVPGPVVVAPVEVPDGVVPQDPATPTTGEPVFQVPSLGGDGGTDSTAFDGTIGTGSEPYFADEVEKAARPLGRQREPRYPDLLRTQRVEGQVIVAYVVDSLGRVEPASVRVVESAHALFEPAVRQAVLATRFRPAEWRGRKVRQLVQQSFVFTLMR